ncbi:uncharacterized protein [Nicotiana tomentosiformis]|uniref:uncharacterized protein n=1 Tax=Nicotiana tomentosiformis TaxID=4098 RepID=UPI00388CAEF8
MTDYEARLSELSRHALMILPTNAERVREVEMGDFVRASYGDSSEDRGCWSAEPRACDEGEAVSIFWRVQWCPDWGQRDPGYIKRYCPKLRVKAVHQSHQPMITAPAAAPAVWTPRGGGQVGRGRPSGGGQTGGGQSGDAPARFYDFPAIPDVVASDAMITGIISICGRDASILFDPGSTYSYVSSLFSHFMGVPREPLGDPVYVSTPVSDSVVVDRIYWSYIVTYCGYETRADLLLLDMTDFEVVLGMDWLSLYHAILDCHAKTIFLVMPELPRL